MNRSKMTWQIFLILVFSSVTFSSSSTTAQDVVPKESKASASSWDKLSDEQLVRAFFPNEKLHFQPGLEKLPDLDPIDGVAVYEVKRVVANFDNDPEDEMAVLLVFSTELLYAEYTNAIFAILDTVNEEIKVRWRTEEGEAFANARLDISAMRLINKDKFFALACTYDSSRAGAGSSYQKMKIIRWDGKKFSEIWSYGLRSHDSGGRGGIPHEYSASVDFLDAEPAKRIRVGAIFTYHHNNEHLRKQYKLNEEFLWSEKEQKYLSPTNRKASPLALLDVHRVGDLPSAKEFPFFTIRALRSVGLDGGGQWEVVIEVERSRERRNEMVRYVLKIDMHKPAIKDQHSFPVGMHSPTPMSSSTLRWGNVSVDLYGFSPQVFWFDRIKGEQRTSLLDDEALISTRKAIFFDLDRDMPGIAVLGTRIANPILKTLNEVGLFLYVWNGQKYILEKKMALPKATQKWDYDIEAFALLTPGLGGNNPAGMFISRKGSYHRDVYVFK